MPAPARRAARAEAALPSIANLNRGAFRAYRQQNFGGARHLLRAALAACSAARLDLHPQAALAHARLAAVLVLGFRQQELGVEHFRQALRIDRHVSVASLIDDEVVRTAFRRAAGSP